MAGTAAAQSPRVIVDDFSPDRLASDYILHQGEPLDVDDGVLRATGPQAPDEVMTHNASAGLVDTEVTLQVNFKTTFEHGTTAAVVKFLSPGNYLRLATTYTSSSIKISKWENGVRSDLLVANDLYTLTPNTTYWVRGRIAGNAISIALWGNDPQQGGTPIASRSYTLRNANAAKFGAGVAGRAGIYLDPFDTEREFDNLRIVGIPAPEGGGGDDPSPPPADPLPGVPNPPTSPVGACEARTLGTSDHDRITGTRGSDFISGFAGDDQIRALAGRDCVFGRTGRDRLRGGSGNDWLVGGRGADRIQAGRGRDRVSAGKGPDRIVVTGNGRDRVSCGQGEDVVYASPDDSVRRDCEHRIIVR